MPILEVKNAAFSYDNPVFSHINFEVDKGEVFCIVGPNGCGKSTLLDCVLGLNKLETGDIAVVGNSIKEYKPRELARHIAYVPQDHKLTFGYSVLDVVSMGRTYEARMFQPISKEDLELARHSLNQVGLSGFEDREYTKLSGGELQLVLIARALTQKADLLVMDEPTSHLDFRHELECMEIITRLVKEESISVVMATHFLNQAFYLENEGVNTQVALMNDGHFGAIGTPNSVLTEENLENVFNIITEVCEDKSKTRKYIVSLYNKG